MDPRENWSPFSAWQNRRRVALPDALLFAAIVSFGAFISVRAAQLPQYGWNWPLLLEFVWKKDTGQPGLLLTGLFTTLRAGLWIFIFALLTGVLVGAVNSFGGRLTRLLCALYVNLARNTPPLVLLFCVYFFAGNFLPIQPVENALRQSPPWLSGFAEAVFASPGQLDRMVAAVLALGLYEGAFIAEITRGGIQGVDKGQWDAARALGFGTLATIRLFILPQGVRLILPPLTGQLIITLKETALVALISLPDLTFQSLEIMAVSNMTFEIWITTGLIYLLLGIICAVAGRLLENYCAWPH